jgi:hypothetical protein
MARTSHLPNLGLVVAWVTSRLVTKESQGSGSGSPKVKFSFWSRDFPYRFRTHGCSVSLDGHAACGIEPLGDLGKRIVASMQQIAFRDLGQTRKMLLSC